jgi:hypothetical protein
LKIQDEKHYSTVWLGHTSLPAGLELFNRFSRGDDIRVFRIEVKQVGIVDLWAAIATGFTDYL